MSLTDDSELQDLVKQTLEKSGSMSRIRAELRANVFLALEQNGCFENFKSKNNNLQAFAKNADGLLLLCLVREFLVYFGLSFTTSVFDPELASYGIECNCRDHIKLSDQLKESSNLSNENAGPLLCQMLEAIRNFQGNARSQKPNNFEESSHLQTCKSTDTSTEYYPLQPVLPLSKLGKDMDQPANKKDTKTESNSKPFSKINSDIKNNSPIVYGTDTDFSKHSLSSLGDLPPLMSQSSSTKNSLSPLNKSSKQMNKLKAMLIDSTSSDNNDDVSSSSIITDDEKEDEKKLYEDICEIEELFEKEEWITSPKLNSC